MKTMTWDEYDQRRHGPLWWTARILATLMVFGVIALLLWRVFSSGDPKEITVMRMNPKLSDAYRAAEAEGKTLTVFSTDQQKYTSVPNKNYSYFWVTSGLLIPEADQVQLVFRYNNSTIRHLKEDYALETMPDRAEELYDVTLLVAYDLTPDVKEDNDGNDPASVKFVRIHASDKVSAQKNLYNYRRFVFEDVGLNNEETPILGIYVDVYYKGDVNYDAEPYGTLMIYDYAAARIPYELTEADVKAIKGMNRK